MLIGLQLAVAVAMLPVAARFDGAEVVYLLFALNLVLSWQDVATDAFAVDHIPAGLRGRVNAVMADEFEAYLRCGILEHGVAHLACRRCGESVVVGFSCKKRGFCPKSASAMHPKVPATDVVSGLNHAACVLAVYASP